MYQKKFLKILTMALIVVFVLSMVLTGCGSSKTTADSTANATASAGSSASTASESTLEPYTVNYLVTKAIADESDQAVVEENFNKYLAEKIPNTSLHFTFIDGSELANKVTMMSAAGEPFDLVANGLSVSQGAAKGIYIPLDDLLNQYGQTILKRIEAKYWPAVTIDGKKYSIPHPFVYAQSRAYVFKKDLVDKYQFDARSVKGLKDLEPFLEKVKAGEPGITGIFPHRDVFLLEHSYLDYINDFLVYDVNKNQLEWVLDDEKVIENAKTLNDFYKKGYIVKDYISKMDNANAEAKTGKYAIVQDMGIYDESNAKSTSAYGYNTIEVLKNISLVGTGKITSVYTSVSATSKDPARAMMVQDFMYADKTFFNMTCYGKEGLNYEVTANAGTDNPSVKTLPNSKYTIWACWTGPLWDQWDSNWNSAASLAAMKKDTDAAAVSPLLGFTANFETIKKEISQIQAIYDEAYKVLTCGMEPDAEKYLADMKERVKAAGLDNVITEVNKQIADWKATNGK